MRVLVTGATGFVGRHLTQLLVAQGHRVYGTYLTQPKGGSGGAQLVPCDVRDAAQLHRLLRRIRPQRIYHLAAHSSVVDSFRDIRAVYETNFWGTYNLLEAARQGSPRARVLVVSSGHCYGPIKRGQRPAAESQPLAPQNPYALSKAAADLLAGLYHARHGLHVVRARPLNHTGPGQSPEFVCSDFARQAAAIDLGLQAPVLSVGNLDVERNFSDVRDVVRAYVLLLEKGKAGEAYNVASGRRTTVRRLVKLLTAFSSRPIRVRVERRRQRLADLRRLTINTKRLRRTTGWRPEYDLPKTLKDLFLYWKEVLQTGRR